MAYTKTTWVDRIVQFANRFTKSNETSSNVDLVANPGVVTQVGTPLSAGNLNKIEQGIADAHDMLAAAGTLPFVLKHGLNIASTTGPSPGNVAVYGVTRVNLLGSYGGFEKDSDSNGIADGWLTMGTAPSAASIDSSNYTQGGKSQKLTISGSTSYTTGLRINPALDAGKYYILLCDIKTDASVSFGVGPSAAVFTSSKTVSANTSFVTTAVKYACTDSSVNMVQVFRTGITSLNLYIDAVRVFEITATDYAKIDVDPEYTGDKLADKFPYVDSVKHLQGAAVRKVGKNLLPPNTQWPTQIGGMSDNYSYTVTATGSGTPQTTYTLQAIPNTQYSLSGIVTPVTNNITFDCLVYDGDNGTGNIIIDSPNAHMTTTTFTTPANAKSIVVRFIVSNSVAAGTVCMLQNPQLEMGSTATPFQPYNADYFNVPAILASNLDGTIRDSAYVRDGQLVKLKRWVTGMQLDGSLSWGWNGDMTGYKRVAFPLTGISASNTSVPAIVNLQAPNGQLFKPLSWLNRGTEANSVSVDNNTSASVLLSVNDSDTGWGESFTPSTSEIKAYFYGWKMNNGTFGTPYDGTGTKTWTLWNATSNTGAVTTVPATLAAGFTPYTLDYVLATSVEEVISGDVGSIALAPGGNQLELLEGVIVREKANPMPYSNPSLTQYRINNTHSNVAGDSKLKRRADKIVAVYKDRVVDPSWILFADGFQYGNQSAYIPAASYDTSADYFVTYILLDKYSYTANATDAKVEYQTTLGGTVAQNTQDIADVRTRNGIQDFGLDYIEAKADNLRIDYDGHSAKTTSVHGSTTAATPNTLAQRDAAGALTVATPTASGHATTRAYVDTLDPYYTPSDTVLLSLPTARGGTSGYLKQITVKYAGKYRLKGEYYSGTAGSAAQGFVRVTISGQPSSTDSTIATLTTSSGTPVSFSVDLSQVPAGALIFIQVQNSPAFNVRNVTLCGDQTAVSPSTLGGVD